MMTNSGFEGKIFLSHPHTNNGFFFLLTIKYHIFIEKKAPRRSCICWGCDIIQLMHSFEVNIRICQPKNSDVHRGKKHVLLYDTVSLFLVLFKVFSYL